MQDDRDLLELKREIVEARNQAIKTDNQVKNLSLDIKGFDRRFALLERRTRIASLGVNLIVVAVVVVAAYLVHAVRSGALVSAAEEQRVAATQARQEADARVQGLQQRATTLEQQVERRQQAEAALIKLVDAIEARDDKAAAALLDSIDLAAVGTAANRLAASTLDDLRRRTADASYRTGRGHALANRLEQAVPELHRALRLDPEGRVATQARYLLATSLTGLKRFEEAVPVLRELKQRDPDRAISDEVRYLLGASLAQVGQKQEATKLLKEAATGTSRFASAAKAALAALDAEEELPPVGAKAASRATASRSTAATPANGTASTAVAPVASTPASTSVSP